MLRLHTTYFGSVNWYAQYLSRADDIQIDNEEHYVKQTERNHCLIMTANGVQKLTVPVTLRHDGPTPIREVRISSHGNWQHLHWQALCSAYGQSPFFDYYADDVRPFFERRWQFLFDFNSEIMLTMRRLIGQGSKGCVVPYYQTFQRRHGFVAGMSILDLLFNEGPETILHI